MQLRLNWTVNKTCRKKYINRKTAVCRQKRIKVQIESQKGIITIQQCSIENQEGAITVQSLNTLGFVYFTWPLRKQAAYKEATRGPVALSPFRGTRRWGYSALPNGTTAAASRFEPGTSQLKVCGFVHWATTAPLVVFFLIIIIIINDLAISWSARVAKS